MMANHSGSFNRGPPDLGEVVRRAFDRVLDVDICTIHVPRLTQQFTPDQLQMIRAAFTVDFSEEDLNWVMEKIIRYVSFLTLDIMTPALMACREMEDRLRGPAAKCHFGVLVKARVGSADISDSQDAGEAGTNARRRNRISDVESPVLYVDSLDDLSISQLLTQSEERQIIGKMGKSVVAITTLLLDTLVPEYAPWTRGYYEGCQDVSEFVRRHRHLPAVTATPVSMIEYTSKSVTDMRRSILLRQRCILSFIPLEDKFIFKHFILESTRALLERLMNVSNGVRLFHTSTAGMHAAEMPFSPQMFMPERDTVRKLLIGAISKAVMSFVSEAIYMIPRDFPPFIRQNTDTDSETKTDEDTSVSSPHLPENSVQSRGSGGHTALVDNGVTETVDACSISDSSSSRSSISDSTGSSRSSSCSSVKTDASSNEDSADLESTKDVTKQRRRRRIFTIQWRVKRSAAAASVEEEASVATEKIRRPSLKSCIASAFSRLCCCCKGQE